MSSSIAARRRELLLVLISLSVSGAPSAASDSPPIRAIRWSGVSALSIDSLAGSLAMRPGVRFDPAGLQREIDVLTAVYRRSGYWRTRVAAATRMSDDSSWVDLEFSVTEGPPALVARILWEGCNRIPPAEAERLFSTSSGSLLRGEDLERDIGRLLVQYEEAGHPFARCSLADATIVSGEGADSLTLTIAVEEGPLVTLEEIRIEGAKETDEGFILRETRLRRGEIYSPGRVRSARDRLNRLGIFTAVGEPELFEAAGRGGILFRVQEGNPNTFDGIVGYLPSRGGGGEVTGLLSLSMRNLFGTGRKLALRWERESRRAQEIGIRYSEPWLAGLPLQFGGGFRQRQQDSAYVRRAGDLRFDILLGDRIVAGVVGGSESVVPSIEGGSAFRSSALTIGGEALYDSRDDAINPTDGFRLRTGYHYGRRSFPAERGGGSATLRRLDWDVEGYAGLFRGQVIAVSLHGRQVAGGGLQEADLYRFGGATSLRGYRENEFLGSTIGWVDVEYRILTGGKGSVFGFLGGGYYQRPELQNGTLPGGERFLAGAGLGVRIETPLGLMEVSIAAGEGDTFGSMKAHVRLISEF